MPQIDTFKVQALFSSMLEKVGLEPSNASFGTLSEKIEDTRPGNPEITQAYLYKRHADLKTALEHGRAKVGLQTVYVNKMCRFLGYEDFRDFDKQWESVYGNLELPAIKQKQVELFVSVNEKNEVAYKVEGTFIAGEQHRIEIQTYSDAATVKVEIKKAKSDGRLVLVCLPKTIDAYQWYTAMSIEFIDTEWKNVFVFQTGNESWQALFSAGSFFPPFYLWRDFGLVCQLTNHVAEAATDTGVDESLIHPRERVDTLLNDAINSTIDIIPAKWSWVSGLGLLTVILLLILVFPCPSTVQLMFMRISVAAGIAGIISSAVDNLEFGSYRVRGTVTLLMFGIIYFTNPARAISFDRCGQVVITGRVTLADRPVHGALVRVPDHGQEGYTGNTGDFRIPLDYRIDDDPTKVCVTFGRADTQIIIDPELLGEPLIIRLTDTVPVINKDIACQMIQNLANKHQEFIEMSIRMRTVELEGEPSTVDVISSKYYPYEGIEAYYRNEFEFTGVKKTIKFRKNLLEAGIWEVDPLEPYGAHHIQDHKAILIAHLSGPGNHFLLEYAFLNNRPLVATCELIRISKTQYKVRVNFKENIRGVLVRLECSGETEGYKRRQMHFYGFQPEEEYTISFTKGAWKLDQIIKP